MELNGTYCATFKFLSSLSNTKPKLPTARMYVNTSGLNGRGRRGGKWELPGWRIEQKYCQGVLIGNWSEDRLGKVRANVCCGIYMILWLEHATAGVLEMRLAFSLLAVAPTHCSCSAYYACCCYHSSPKAVSLGTAHVVRHF